MSLQKPTLRYTAAAAVIAAIIMVSSSLYLGSTTGQLGSNPATLVVQLTDPPQVPTGTSSLSLTYSSVSLLVGEPAGGGQVTTKVVNVPGTDTIDLLKLQSFSKTIVSASLPAGSTLYSVSFAVTGISMVVGGTTYPVTLATGGSSLTITLSHPAAIHGTDIALLQLNPVIVSTPTGYEMIPSSVAVIRGERSSDKGHEYVGSQQQLTSDDDNELNNAHGNVAASLKALSVSGDSTMVTVEVTNNGNTPVDLKAVGLHGSFTVSGQTCPPESTDPTTTTTTSTSTGTPNECEGTDEVGFFPSGTSVSGTGCQPMTLTLETGDHSILGDHGDQGLMLSMGQCVDLTFSGKISFGSMVLVPNIASGQTFELHVAATEGANLILSCQLPLTSTSCSVVNLGQD